jgi:hypothetical protein
MSALRHISFRPNNCKSEKPRVMRHSEVDGVAVGRGGHISVGGEQVMGNRDTRGREKKKPKKKEIKQKGAPARPAVVYKPAPPAAPPPPNPGSGTSS